MKTKLLILLSLFVFLVDEAKSQQLSGRAYYKASNQIMIRIDSADMSPEEIAEAHEIMKKPWQRDFILSFTQTESNWKQMETLENGSSPSASDGMTVNLSGSGDEILYKNLVDQSYVQEQEFMGKEFLIQDALVPRKWELSPETKKIGEYTARKASYTELVDAMHFSAEMTEMENVKDTIRVTVWFTTEIPVAHGPENYFGLPGLILEVHNGGRTYYCEKIELNPAADPVEIEKPKEGKVVSQGEFQLIQEESIQQMQSRYQGKPGEGSKVRIGG
ncbi:GLPGLI family protein [Algoriphagus sp. A40]|uniref:GLPGLI family protein n=1 Tax=Algoriphagus sp. A40 TaxID=1945863 RepID=UPI000984DEAC|nr:GLPGLI family protein [Algoriphagus sp. A40]OOG76825.1 hypothetical protein B0E43_07515 [Algoriphagus sp. A40]